MSDADQELADWVAQLVEGYRGRDPIYTLGGGKDARPPGLVVEREVLGATCRLRVVASGVTLVVTFGPRQGEATWVYEARAEIPHARGLSSWRTHLPPPGNMAKTEGLDDELRKRLVHGSAEADRWNEMFFGPSDPILAVKEGVFSHSGLVGEVFFQHRALSTVACTHWYLRKIQEVASEGAKAAEPEPLPAAPKPAQAATPQPAEVEVRDAPVEAAPVEPAVEATPVEAPPVPPPAKAPKGKYWRYELGSQAMRDHLAWLRSGEGQGRMVAEDLEVANAKLIGERYDGASWERINMTTTDLVMSTFVGADLRDCRFTESSFEFVRLHETTIESCSWRRCHAVGLSTNDARLLKCLFEDCMLARSRWTDAVCDEVSFVRCVFKAADLKGATFRRCTFEGCTVEAGAMDASSFPGATFEECRFS